MSNQQLKRMMREVNQELCILLEQNRYDLQTPAIISCSQRLDLLIVAYMQTAKK
ncbi:Spo0E family sporulation regulatory protein-aspartic acid phosphatase [Clostridiaceae bacterium 35-E11]